MLVAVTKTVNTEVMKELLSHKISHFGENRVQVFLPKYEELKDENITWHFIGNLQNNKVKYIIDKVALIHSVNSVKLADEINKQAAKINKIQDILIEVNTSLEDSKMGIKQSDVDSLVEHIQTLPNLRLKGLMTMAPIVANPQDSKIYFEKLHKVFLDIKERLPYNTDMQYLSMGMTDDYVVALEAKSNMVRIGSGIFK